MKHNCKDCKYEDTEVCDECSNLDDRGCSCHLNPPCSYCVDNKFEEK